MKLLQLLLGSRLAVEQTPGMVDFKPKVNELCMQSKGLWRGKPYSAEGHQRFPEFYATLVSMSDDEGKTGRLAQAVTGLCSWCGVGWFDTLCG